jgi:hypothetical protein
MPRSLLPLRLLDDLLESTERCGPQILEHLPHRIEGVGIEGIEPTSSRAPLAKQSGAVQDP